MVQTPRGITQIQATEQVALASDQNRMASEVDVAISNAVAEVLPVIAPSGFNADLVDKNASYIITASTGATNIPSGAAGSGVLTTYVLSPSGFRPKMQTFRTASSTPSDWTRFSGSVGWSPWKRMDAGAVPEVPPSAPPQSAAGFRTVPLALTVGGSAANGATSGIMRMPVKFARRITRWRIHFRNNNPRFGQDGSAVTLSQVFFGPATAGQFTQAPTLIASARTTATMTPWQRTPIEAGVEYAVSYSFSTAGTTNRVVGGGWSASSVSSQSATLTPVTSMPLDAWIEAEVAPDTPVLAVLGDSLASGVGAALPVYDSWLSIYCRRVGALPVHYTASGDTMESWSDPLSYKWTRWRHLSRPDAIIHAMGSNDVFGGASLATMQARRAATVKIASEQVSPVVATATILPRTVETGAVEDTRRAYNTWLKTTPDVAREVYDIVPPVSGNDEALSPGFDADGTHLNTSGYTAVQTAITSRVTSGLTDWLTLANGTRAKRVGNVVYLNRYGSLPAGTGTVDADTLPVGYRPSDTEAGLYFAGSTSNPPGRVHILAAGAIRYYAVPASGAFVTMSATFVTNDPMPA